MARLIDGCWNTQDKQKSTWVDTVIETRSRDGACPSTGSADQRDRLIDPPGSLPDSVPDPEPLHGPGSRRLSVSQLQGSGVTCEEQHLKNAQALGNRQV